MLTSTLNDHLPSIRPDISRRDESGFSLLETIVAMFLVTIGLLALAAALTYALAASNMSRNVSDSKMVVTSTLEQIETLRNTQQLTFGQIANQGFVVPTGAKRPFAGFPSDFRAVTASPGPDGIYGTDDDLVDPGEDLSYGTGDDVTNPALAREGYSRRILITSMNAYLKKVEVTLRYPGQGRTTIDLIGVIYLNNDARGTFRR